MSSRRGREPSRIAAAAAPAPAAAPVAAARPEAPPDPAGPPAPRAGANVADVGVGEGTGTGLSSPQIPVCPAAVGPFAMRGPPPRARAPPRTDAPSPPLPP